MRRAASRLICEAPVFYVDGDGQTRQIAERLAAGLRRQRLNSRAIHIGSPAEKAIDWSGVRGAIVGGSTNRPWHQNELHAFVSGHVHDLNASPTAFFSVTIGARHETDADRQAARRLAASFPAIHEWKPMTIVTLRGRIAVGWMDVMTRWATKWLTGRDDALAAADYEFTSWERVDRLASAMAATIRARTAKHGTAA